MVGGRVENELEREFVDLMFIVKIHRNDFI